MCIYRKARASNGPRLSAHSSTFTMVTGRSLDLCTTSSLHIPSCTLVVVRLQGAAFSGGTLHQQSPNDPELAGVPDVTLAYVHKEESRPYQVGTYVNERD